MPENKAIGRNMYMYRKLRGMKALEVAEGLGLKEASYTLYERGEAAITVDMIQKVTEILTVDPVTLMTEHPGNFIKNGSNSPIAINGNSHYQTVNEKQTEMMLKLMENVLSISDKILMLLDKGQKG